MSTEQGYRRIAIEAMKLMTDEQLLELRLALDELDREALAQLAAQGEISQPPSALSLAEVQDGTDDTGR